MKVGVVTMLLQTLPNEILLLIAQHVSIKGLAAWIRTSRHFKFLLTDHLYSAVRDLDEEEYGFPATLILTFRKKRVKAFTSLLNRTTDLDTPNIKLRAFGHLDDDIFGPVNFSRDPEPKYLTILFALCYLDLVDIRPSVYRLTTASSGMIKCLLQRGVDIFTRDEGGWTVLHYLATGLYPDILSQLIEDGADMSARTDRGETPLHMAAKCRGPVEPFIRAGADISATTEHGFTPLHSAVHGGSLQVVQSLVEAGSDVRAETAALDTPFTLAVGEQCLEIMDYLLECGADIPNPALLGRLLVGFRHYFLVCTAFVERLIQLGTDLSIRDRSGNNALHLATDRNNKCLAQCLIENGIDISAQRRNGDTALGAAIRRKSLSMTYFLLKAGADSSIPLGNDGSPLYFAVRRGWNNIVECLVDAGADCGRPSDDEAVLHVATRNRHLEIVKVLVRGGAYASTREAGGYTPLHIAAEKGFDDVGEWLIQAGADTSARTESGNTPLHLLVQQCVRRYSRVKGYLSLIGCVLIGYTNISIAEVQGKRTELEPLYQQGFFPLAVSLCTHGDHSLLNSEGLTSRDILTASTHPLDWNLLSKEFTATGKVTLPDADNPQDDDDWGNDETDSMFSSLF